MHAKQTPLRVHIDDDLLAEARLLTGASSTRDVVEQSLQLFVRLKRQGRLRRARGFLKSITSE